MKNKNIAKTVVLGTTILGTAGMVFGTSKALNALGITGKPFEKDVKYSDKTISVQDSTNDLLPFKIGYNQTYPEMDLTNEQLQHFLNYYPAKFDNITSEYYQTVHTYEILEYDEELFSRAVDTLDMTLIQDKIKFIGINTKQIDYTEEYKDLYNQQIYGTIIESVIPNASFEENTNKSEALDFIIPLGTSIILMNGALMIATKEKKVKLNKDTTTVKRVRK